MPSLARHLYDTHATPTLFNTFSNERVDIVYRMGDVETRNIKGIVRDRQIAMEMDAIGDVNKEERCSIVISSDPSSIWGGIAAPQLKATWEIVDENNESSVWVTDASPGRGIEALSESLVMVHLVRLQAMAKSTPNYRPQ